MRNEAAETRALLFKIDENIPIDALPVFAQAGFECR